MSSNRKKLARAASSRIVESVSAGPSAWAAALLAKQGWRGGGLYKHKAVVADVPQPGVCALALDAEAAAADEAAVGRARGGGGRLLDGVPQGVLETALPKPGGEVLVVAGRYRPARGVLLSRGADLARVRLIDEDVIVDIGLDDLAEWVGS